MNKLVYVLVAATTWLLASCGEAFFEDDFGEMTTKTSSLRALDISTTNITAMTEADFQALDAAMERLGVEYDGRFHIIQRTDYQNLNVSKKLYWTIKQLCENGNRLVASIHHDTSFPLIKNGNREQSYQSVNSDCVAYALYGMGNASLQSTQSYISTNFPEGVPPDSLEYVISYFYPSFRVVHQPAEDFLYTDRPRPLVWYQVSTIEAHAVNAIHYFAKTHTFYYADYSTGSSLWAGIANCSECSDFYYSY